MSLFFKFTQMNIHLNKENTVILRALALFSKIRYNTAVSIRSRTAFLLVESDPVAKIDRNMKGGKMTHYSRS